MIKVTPIAAASARVHAGNFFRLLRKIAETFSSGAFRPGRRGFVGGLVGLSVAPALAKCAVLPTSDLVIIRKHSSLGPSESKTNWLAYDRAEFNAEYVRALALAMAIPAEQLSLDYYSTRYAPVRDFGFGP